jgi:citrate lyase beta subunit
MVAIRCRTAGRHEAAGTVALAAAISCYQFGMTRWFRSLLFSPGSRPDRVARALASRADAVCVDLEDAVAPAEKAEARKVATGFLGEAEGPARIVRINRFGNADGLRDLLAIIEARPSEGIVFLPKVESSGEVAVVDSLLGEAGLPLGIGVLIETTGGLEHAAEIAAASPRIAFLMFGGADLAGELGTAIADMPLLYGRSRVVAAAVRAGVQVLDMPTLNFRDAEAVRKEAERARALGFTGKAVVHPDNVAAVNAAFMPGEAEIASAERIIAAAKASKAGVVVVDGRMVDRPVVRAAERVIALAARGG